MRFPEAAALIVDTRNSLRASSICLSEANGSSSIFASASLILMIASSWRTVIGIAELLILSSETHILEHNEDKSLRKNNFGKSSSSIYLQKTNNIFNNKEENLKTSKSTTNLSQKSKQHTPLFRIYRWISKTNVIVLQFLSSCFRKPWSTTVAAI